MTVYLDGVDVWDGESYGTYAVTAEGIVAFAEQYDPQPFHTDPDRAADSIYGGLIASGWHTAAMSMRLFVDGFLSETASMGSKGLDRLRWPAPVRPGDELTVHSTVLDTEVVDDDKGWVRWQVDTTADGDDGADRDVFSMEALVLVGRD
ncbi:MAG: MaoC/PaaZ C-terminal domain-containing protein [Haloplanus sp.]